MTVSEYLRDIAIIRERKGNSLHATRLREIAHRYEAMLEALEMCVDHHHSLTSNAGAVLRTVLSLARATIEKETTDAI